MLRHHYERNIFHLFGSRFEEYIGSSSIPFLGGGKFHDRNLFTVFSLRCIQRHSSREGAIPRSEERKQATRIDLISTSRIPIHPLWLKFESIPGRHRVGNRPPCFVESVTILLPPLPAKNPIYTRTRVEDLVRWGVITWSILGTSRGIDTAYVLYVLRPSQLHVECACSAWYAEWITIISRRNNDGRGASPR